MRHSPIETVVAFPSAARTATPTAFDYTNKVGYRGMIVCIDATAITATPSVTVTISHIDPVSGKLRTLLASAVIATVSTTFLRIYPGATAAANQAANEILGTRVRIAPAHADADSITYSIAVDFVDGDR